MRNSILPILVFLFAVNSADARVIVLDSGHDTKPGSVGAIGACGKPEYQYNDEVTAEVLQRFKNDSSFAPVMTRQAGRDVSITHLSPSVLKQSLSPKAFGIAQRSPNLVGRAAIANSSNCDAFISVHHDSVPDAVIEGRPDCSMRIKSAFKKKYQIGYSVLVYEDDQGNPNRVTESRKLAAAIAARMKNDLKRIPSNYHGRDGDCMNDCRDVNPELGIIHKDVSVLRETRCPAVLVEIGNISDGGAGGDEQRISTAAFRASVADAIKRGVDDYFKNAGTPGLIPKGESGTPASTPVR